MNLSGSQLCLIPKVEGIPRSDQMRPISVANSDYRIMTRYWAIWFAECASGFVSNFQCAMFKRRSIDSAVKKVHYFFLEAIAKGEEATILQIRQILVRHMTSSTVKPSCIS